MAWRKIEKKDIQRGVIIRMTRIMDDGGFHTAVIVCTSELEAPGYPNVKVARPYAYAHEHFNTNQPLLGAEVFSIGVDRMTDASSDVEVFEDRNGSVRRTVT